MSCELCDLEKKSIWYEENEFFIICECITCKVPMLVWKEHNFPTKETVDLMKRKVMSMFPGRKIDMNRRKIPDHFHFHAR